MKGTGNIGQNVDRDVINTVLNDGKAALKDKGKFVQT